MKSLLVLGGHHDGRYLAYDPSFGPTIREPYLDPYRREIVSFSENPPPLPPPKISFYYDSYKVAALTVRSETGPQTYEVLVPESMSDGDAAAWIVERLLRGYRHDQQEYDR
jgi:hypothetical protein